MKLKGAPQRPRHRDGEAGTASYQRHVDCEETKQRRQHTDVHLAFRAKRYQLLIEQEVKEEKQKRVRKNVGKALRSTWKCLMLGLYNFALCYSTPATVAATFVPDFSPARNRT